MINTESIKDNLETAINLSRRGLTDESQITLNYLLTIVKMIDDLNEHLLLLERQAGVVPEHNAKEIPGKENRLRPMKTIPDIDPELG